MFKVSPEDWGLPGWEGCAFLFIYLIYSNVHTLFGSLLSPVPCPHPLNPNPPHFQAESVLPLSLTLLKRKHKHNKKDIPLLLVELRIAIQGDF
jgi:hypothetical protein